MDPVVHFEMPAEDRDRMVSFYEKAFGWRMQKLGKEMGQYTTVTTTEIGEDGRPTVPGAINGGFYLRTDDPISQTTGVVVAVENLGDSVKRVEEAGGTVLRAREDIPGVGAYASVLDTEGNRVSLLEPAPRMSVHPS